MSHNSLQEKIALTLYAALSVAHAITSLLAELLPCLTLVSLTLAASTLASATVLCKIWGTGEEE